MIKMHNINKTFRVARRNAGMREAIKSLFQKQYDVIHALNDISFTIDEGEMVGYIGPNGAGKSSTIKIMSGILTPDSGECIINGLIPWKNRIEYVREIGVVFGQRSQLWWDLPVADSFRLLKDIYQISEKKYRENVETLSSLLNIETIIKTPARQLSLGQRMRCEIAASLIHSPKILFLDEPTIGLDAVSKIAVRNFIQDINRQYHTTVILTTHDMQDIEALTKRILLIGKGRILLDGELETLKKEYSQNKRITIDYQRGSFMPCQGLAIETHHPGRIIVSVNTDVLSVSSAISHLSVHAEVTDIAIQGATAEEIIISLYEEHHI